MAQAFHLARAGTALWLTPTWGARHAGISPFGSCYARTPSLLCLGDQTSPTRFYPPACRPTMPQISVRHSCQSSCKLSSLSHRHCPLGSTGESIPSFCRRSTRLTLLSDSADEWQKDGHTTSQFTHVPSLLVSYLHDDLHARCCCWMAQVRHVLH